MLDRIRALFNGTPKLKVGGEFDRTLAAAALLIEAALLDGTFSEKERTTIHDCLVRNFALSKADAGTLIEEAIKAQAEANHLVRFTRALKEAYDPEERTAMLEMLWEVAYADGALHHYEANLLRRVSGLLYVPDREAGAARKRVLARLGLEDLPPA